MQIVKIQDFCVILTILRNKTNTHLVKKLETLLTKFWLQHKFTIQVAELLLNLCILTHI